jgi:glutamate-ammonia-ligase adenylyltransferase
MTDPVTARIGAGRLARQSFADPATAAELLAGKPLGWWNRETGEPTSPGAANAIAALGRSADPDAALGALAELAGEPGGEYLVAGLERDAELRRRTIGLLAVCSEFGPQPRRNPGDWAALNGPLDVAGAQARIAAAVGADPADPVRGSEGRRATVTGAAAALALRDAYRRELFAVAARDVAEEIDIVEVTEALADLAGFVLQAALAVAAAELDPRAAPCRLAIVAMGKAGARELNYVSDVDVVFVAEPVGDADPEPALRTATLLASATMRLCHVAAWEVDAALRPEGKDGALVRTLASHEAYYRRWASTWEFQALLKARPVAGDLELGQAYRDVIAPLVWTAAERADFVPDVQAMRRRVVAHLPKDVKDREIKLGPGGLRDVEFAVQLLQLVHGRGDETLRVAATLSALAALRDGGYVGRDDAVRLGGAYAFLRQVEHRLQLRRLRRTHLVPADPAGVAWLSRAMGYRPDRRGDAPTVFAAEWSTHAREVRRLHEKLFYRPLLDAVARVPTEGLRLTPDEAGRRLAALGFSDPAAALRHIESLTGGLSRRAALQRALLPVLLSDFADAPDPDAGLLAYRRLSDELGATPWYLRTLRDGGMAASRLAQVLATSRYVARMLGRAPDALQLLADDEELRPREPAETLATMREAAERQRDAAAAVAVVRGVRRQELLRTAFADLLGLADVVSVCQTLSATTGSTLEVALEIASRDVAAAHGLETLPIRFAVIAMGRLGGTETGYGSDADVMFVEESTDGDEETASRLAFELAGRLRALLNTASSTDPPVELDADLRPEGRNGALVRSLASYERYYARWSLAWEAQALLRARPVAGDVGLGERFVAMIDPVRYPDGGLSNADLLEIRRLKGRIDAERLPRGADPTTHTKLGRGGLADIEWTVQLLQLAHGAAVPGLRTTRTIEALHAAAGADLISDGQAESLIAAWRLATRVRNALVLVRDRPEDQIPTVGRALEAVGRVLGYPPGFDHGKLLDDYRRTARHARRVVEDVFYS